MVPFVHKPRITHQEEPATWAALRQMRSRGSRASAVTADAQSTMLLSDQAWKSLRPRDRRRVPFAGKRLGLRGVEAHGQIEGAFRRRQPVGFLVLARALVLEIEIERAVGVVFERHPAADREAIEAVRDLEASVS